MSMTLPVYVAAHKADAVRREFKLVKIETYGTVVTFTDCEERLSWGGTDFWPTQGVSVGDIVGADGEPLRASIEIGNGDGLMTILGHALVGADATPAVTIWSAWLDPDSPSFVVESAYVLAAGVMESPSWTSEKLSFTLAPDADPGAYKAPARVYGDGCTWRGFKGPECGYAGAATSCNRSWAACTALGNTARFGGFRSLPRAGQTLKAGTFTLTIQGRS